MDGTLLDTMYIWRNLAKEYLIRHNIAIPEELKSKLVTMGIIRAINVLREDFQINMTPEKIQEGLFEVLEDYYTSNSVFKPGARELLENLRSRNIPTVLLSATPERFLRLALGKLDAIGYLSNGILSCASLPYNKQHPESFFIAAEHLHSTPAETVVFEDAWYAANTAKKAGFTVAIIADKSELKVAETRELADFYAEKSWDEFPFDRFF